MREEKKTKHENLICSSEKWLLVRADGIDDGGDDNDVDGCSLSAILANTFSNHVA